MRRRLVKDLKQLKDGLSEGTVVAYSSENISNMMGIIIGPGKLFVLLLQQNNGWLSTCCQ